MAEDGNNRNGNGRNGPQQQRPPADLEKKRLKNENKQLKATLTQLMADRGMPEGPMGTGQGQSNFPLTSDDVRDMDILEGEDGASGGTWEPQPMMVGQQIPPSQVHPEVLAQGPGDVLRPPREKSKMGKKAEAFGREAAASPVKSVLSRILDWRFLGFAVVPIVAHATYKLFAFPQRLSFGGIPSQYLSSAKTFAYAISHPIKAVTELEFAFGGKFLDTMGKVWDIINPASKFSGMEFPSWGAAGTIGAVVAGAAFTLSAILNVQNLSKVFNRVSKAIVVFSLPSIIPEILNNLDAKTRTISNIFDLSPGGVGALYISALLFAASYISEQGNPLLDWAKRKRRSREMGEGAASQPQGTMPLNAVSRKPGIARRAGSAVLGAITFLPKKAIGAITYFPKKGIEALKDRFGGKRSPRTGEPAFAAETQEMPQRGRSQAEEDALDAATEWAKDGGLISRDVLSRLRDFMLNAPTYSPGGEWIPVFNTVVEAEPQDHSSPEYTQFDAILSHKGVFRAVNALLDVYTSQLDMALNEDVPRVSVDEVDVGSLRQVHGVLAKYARIYERDFQEFEPIQRVRDLEAAILQVERRQNGND